MRWSGGGRGLVIAISFMVGFRKIVRRVSSFYVGRTQGHGVLNQGFKKK